MSKDPIIARASHPAPVLSRRGCGCEVCGGYHIHFCPTHALAPELLTLAERIARACYCPIHPDICPGEDCDACPACLSGRARRILARIDRKVEARAR